MKVLEAQSAVLSNFEVYQHLSELRKRNKKKQKRPPNQNSAVNEVLAWLQEHPSPLSQKPMPYNSDTITTLLERLRPYDLSKGEVVAILNIRPSTLSAFNAIVDDMAERFTEEQQFEILGIIAEVLGEFPAPEGAAADQNGDAGDGGENGTDVAMGNSAA